MKNIAIFASLEGTNAKNIIKHFNQSSKAKVSIVISNNPSANVINRAKKEHIETLIIDRETFYNSLDVINDLKHKRIDFIVLAGFLWLIPEHFILAFPRKIINIHPSLLPKYGGKGMYGMNVHKAIVEAKEKESGITIHYVNEIYDKGEIISQHTCVIDDSDTPESVAKKIHGLETMFLPQAIEQIID